jgi:hypothetical protein
MLPGFLFEASLGSTRQLPELEQRHLDAFQRLDAKIARMIQILGGR